MRHLMIALLVVGSFANAQTETTQTTTTTVIESGPGTSVAPLDSIFVLKKNVDEDGVEYYENNAHLRTFKRFGMGATVGGVAGVLGIQAEFNLDPLNSAIAGIGMGPGYNSFNFRFKRSLEANYLAPYGTVGYSKWYNTSTNSTSYRDSDVLNRVLTDSEKSEGKFGADFITAAIGLEYTQLEGQMSGTTFFGEIVLMDEIKRSVLVPTGTVGVSYLF